MPPPACPCDFALHGARHNRGQQGAGRVARKPRAGRRSTTRRSSLPAPVAAWSMRRERIGPHPRDGAWTALRHDRIAPRARVQARGRDGQARPPAPAQSHTRVRLQGTRARGIEAGQASLSYHRVRVLAREALHAGCRCQVVSVIPAAASTSRAGLPRKPCAARRSSAVICGLTCGNSGRPPGILARAARVRWKTS